MDGVYRNDIQILRGTAVLSVFLFHLNPEWLASGYLGVDMFFVISGYLISRNITREYQSHRFSFKKFYANRFARLYPSLLITLALSTLFAALIIPKDRLSLFKGSVLSSLFGVSNFYFWTKLDYFTENSRTIPLLHTWSLGVEEQFYLLWPAFLLLSFHFIKKKNTHLLLVSLLISFNFFYLTLAPEGIEQALFYWLPFRTYEFLLGYLILLIEERKLTHHPKAKWMSLPILALLCFCLSKSSFERDQALILQILAVVSTAFLIFFRFPSSFEKLLFPLKKLGDISYQFYLIHWPLIAFYESFFFQRPTLPATLALTVLTLFFSVSLYILSNGYYQKFKKTDSKNRKKELLWPSLGTLFTLFLGLCLPTLSFHLNLYAFDLDNPKTESLLNRRYAGEHCDQYSLQCDLGDPKSRKRVFLFGDSTAQSLYFGLNNLFKEQKIKLVSVNYPGCLILKDVDIYPIRLPNVNFDQECIDWIKFAYTIVEDNNDPVILTHKYDGFYRVGESIVDFEKAAQHLEKSLEKTIQFLSQTNRKIILIKSYYYPETYGMDCLVAKGIHADCPFLTKEDFERDNKYVNQSMDRLASRYQNLKVIDFNPILCPENKCGPFLGDTLMFYDCCHFTEEGSSYLINQFKDQILEVIAN